ncbi:chemotaxis regulatory protein ChePep [Helicobacter pylori]
MKMILFNQNPMITKLLESVSKKLELSMEDFNHYQELPTRLKEDPEWILIADDECLEKLDQVDWLELKEIISQNKNSVCMYKKGNEAQPFLEGFEMKIKKPFLPTEVLKVLQKKLGSNMSDLEPSQNLDPTQEVLETNWDELENLGDLEALVQEEPNNEEQLLPTLNTQEEKEEVKEEEKEEVKEEEKEEVKEEVKETPQEEKPKDDEIQEGETLKDEEVSKELETQEELEIPKEETQEPTKEQEPIKEKTQEIKEEKQEKTQEEVKEETQEQVKEQEPIKEETQENKEEKQEKTQDSPSTQELEAMQELVKEIQENSNGQEDKKETQENTETPQDVRIPQELEKQAQELETPQDVEIPQESTETPQEKETQELEIPQNVEIPQEKTQKLETQEDHYESIEDIPEPVMAQAMGEELPFLSEAVAKTPNNENDTETPKESAIKTPQEKEESNKTSSPLELRLNLQDLLKSLNQESLKSLLENKTLSIKITLEDKKPDA